MEKRWESERHHEKRMHGMWRTSAWLDLFHRAEKICTDFPEKEKEKKHVTQALQNNGYPRSLMTKNWRPTTTIPRNPDQDTPTAFVTLPYIRHLSETIRRILSPLGIQTCFRPHCTLRQTLVRVKDSRPPQQRPAGCCVQDPLWNVPQGLHRSDWQDTGAPA